MRYSDLSEADLLALRDEFPVVLQEGLLGAEELVKAVKLIDFFGLRCRDLMCTARFTLRAVLCHIRLVYTIRIVALNCKHHLDF